jgi:agmatine deiminase
MYCGVCFALLSLVLVSCKKEDFEATILGNSDAASSVANPSVANRLLGANATAVAAYTMPDENQLHEGTWLQWPHHYEYGTTYRSRLDATWVAMTKALVQSEKVHIIAYNATEKTRIIALLTTAGVAQTKIDFRLLQTNDVWARDNCPIFVKNSAGVLTLTDWGFNGWGNKTPYAKDNVIPNQIGAALGKPVVNLNASMVLEGGAFEIDGAGVFVACKSSILNPNRNPNMTQVQAETILKNNLGVTKFVWLTGVAGLELTDMHIDGFMKFANTNTIVTMSQNDLLDWDVPQADITKLFTAKKVNNTAYNFVYLPLTQNNVTTAYGKALGYKGSYCNYYVANNRVLVPNYNDPNDAIANAKIQALYPGRTVVGIDVRNLYENGGMIHCVTQQQPL